MLKNDNFYFLTEFPSSAMLLLRKSQPGSFGTKADIFYIYISGTNEYYFCYMKKFRDHLYFFKENSYHHASQFRFLLIVPGNSAAPSGDFPEFQLFKLRRHTLALRYCFSASRSFTSDYDIEDVRHMTLKNSYLAIIIRSKRT